MHRKAMRARFIATLAGLAASAAATAQVPTDWTIQMQARTGGSTVTPFNLPAPASLSSSQTIAIDADGGVVFRVSNIAGNVDNNGIFYGKDGMGGLIVGPTTSTEYDSDVDINGGRIALAFGFFGTGGEVRDTTGALLQSYPSAQDFNGISINSAGALGYRAGGSTSGSHVIDEFAPTRMTTTVASNGAVYNFLATPNFNDNRQMASIVRFTSSNGFGVVRWNDDGSATPIAADDTHDPASIYNGFFNSSALNNAGQVAFYPRLAADSTRRLVRSDGVTSTVIAAEGDLIPGMLDTIEGFPSFEPAINSQGWVAFRADQAFGQGIFIGDGTDLVRIIGLDDIVDTQQGQFIIQGFVSAVDMNDAGQISFIATLADGSRAAFVASPVVDGCPADLNGDGIADVFDLLDYLDDWFAGNADRTGDGTTDVFDLLDYLDVWFAGC